MPPAPLIHRSARFVPFSVPLNSFFWGYFRGLFPEAPRVFVFVSRHPFLALQHLHRSSCFRKIFSSCWSVDFLSRGDIYARHFTLIQVGRKLPSIPVTGA